MISHPSTNETISASHNSGCNILHTCYLMISAVFHYQQINRLSLATKRHPFTAVLSYILKTKIFTCYNECSYVQHTILEKILFFVSSTSETIFPQSCYVVAAIYQKLRVIHVHICPICKHISTTCITVCIYCMYGYACISHSSTNRIILHEADILHMLTHMGR